MINAFIIPTTARMRMSITNILPVDAESSGVAVEKVFMFAGYTVFSSSGGRLAAPLTSMRVKYLLILLVGKPIVKIAISQKTQILFTITDSTYFPISPTRAPDFSVSLKELMVLLVACGIDGKHLI